VRTYRSIHDATVAALREGRDPWIDLGATASEAADVRAGDDFLPDGDGFERVTGPSLAAIHRQWLDRGLPAETWSRWAARAIEGGAS
jgi:hypothetical protein